MLSSVFQVGKSCGELSGVDEMGGVGLDGMVEWDVNELGCKSPCFTGPKPKKGYFVRDRRSKLIFLVDQIIFCSPRLSFP